MLRHRFRPECETLESREVPSTYTWTNADNNGLWSDNNNWSGGGGGTPGSFDNVVFNGGGGGHSNTSCTVSSIGCENLTVENGYTGTIALTSNFTTYGTTTITGSTGSLDAAGYSWGFLNSAMVGSAEGTITLTSSATGGTFNFSGGANLAAVSANGANIADIACSNGNSGTYTLGNFTWTNTASSPAWLGFGNGTTVSTPEPMSLTRVGTTTTPSCCSAGRR